MSRKRLLGGAVVLGLLYVSGAVAQTITPPDIAVYTASLNVSTPAGTAATRSVTIANTGGSPLSWGLSGILPKAGEPLALAAGQTQRRLPFPIKDYPKDFGTYGRDYTPMGIAFDGTFLWVTGEPYEIPLWEDAPLPTYFPYIYKLDPLTGAILGRIDLSAQAVGIRGLCSDGSRLWAADYLGRRIFVLDPKTGAVLTSFPNPQDSGWVGAITIGNGILWVYEGNRIHRMDPATGAWMGFYQFPTSHPVFGNGTALKGFAWSDGGIWAGLYRGSLLHKLNPYDGTVSKSIPAPGLGATSAFSINGMQEVGDGRAWAAGFWEDYSTTRALTMEIFLFGLGETEWLSGSPYGGSVAAGGSQVLTVALDGVKAGPGIRQGAIRLAANDPDEPLTSIPVAFTVTGGNAAPDAALAASTTKPAVGQAVAFSASASKDPDGSIVSYRWNFDDGTPEVTTNVASISHAYAQANGPDVGKYSYTARVTVTDNGGKTDAAYLSMSVGPIANAAPPTAVLKIHTASAADVSHVKVGEPVTFDASASTDPATGKFLYFLFAHGDGTGWPWNTNNPFYVFDGWKAPGTYDTSVVAVSPVASAIGYKTITVDPTGLDFQMTEISATTHGMCVVVKDTVKNVGMNPTAKTFKVRYSLARSLSPRDILSGWILGERFIGGLGGGASSSAVSVFEAPAGLAGNCYLVAIVDSIAATPSSIDPTFVAVLKKTETGITWVNVAPNGATTAPGFGLVPEDNERNNLKYLATPLSIPGPGVEAPDLVVPGVSATASGRTLTVTDTVQNVGCLSTTATFKVRYYLSLDPAITSSDILLGTRSVDGLSQGAISTGSMSFTVPTSLPPGSYYVGVIADETGAVAEADESNNTGRTSSTYPFRPDLVFSSFSASISSGKVSVSNTFRNLGTAATAGGFAGAFYLSADAVLGAGDVPLGTRSRTSALNAGGGDADTTKFAAPATLPPGDYYVIGVVDSMAVQTELVESNNRSVTASKVSVRADLYVSSISVSASGRTLSVTSTVRNDGPLPAGAFRVDFRLSPDSTITTADPLLGSRSVAAGLAYGASNTATVTLTIPSTVPAGSSQRAGAIADAGSAVPETSEANNTKASSSFTVAP